MRTRPVLDVVVKWGDSAVASGKNSLRQGGLIAH